MSSPLGAKPVTAVRIAMPPTGPAMFVERRPVGVLAGAQNDGAFIAGLVSLPRPAHPTPSIDCATSVLHLPLHHELAPELHGVPGRAGIECLWTRDDSWLLVPSYVREELVFERAWNVGLLTTPSSIGCPYPADTLAQAAWMVIAAAPAAHVVRLLGGVAALLDETTENVAVSVDLARIAQPGEMAGSLLAAAHAGATWLYGRCLRWIVRERLIAALMGNLCPYRSSPPWELVAAMFPSLTEGNAPTDADLLRAAWFLHDSFIGSGIDEASSLEGAARVTAALTYGSARPGSWLARLTAWSGIWSVDDGHNVAATPQGWGGPRPSELRSKATRELGMPVDAWYGAVTAILTRIMLSHADGTPALTSRHGSDSISIEIEHGEVIVVDASRAFHNVLAHGAVTLDELAASVAQDAKHASRPYRGYGTLPQHEANATRRHPVVVFPDGSWIITDVGAFAEWAADLPLRLLEGSGASGRRSPARSTAGLMFEGYVLDQLDRLTDRHRVTPGRVLDAVVPKKSQRPDGLVANNDGVVAVECSLKPLRDGIAAGDADSFSRLVDQYIQKAKQARAVFDSEVNLSRFVVATAPGAATYLVVTDVPITYVPPLAAVLRARDPAGAPRFVCGIEDLVMLVDLCSAGWSFPAAILAWQRGPFDLPLRTHLEKLARFRSPSSWSNVDAVESLIRTAPQSRSGAA